jgi:hypothetical protein
MILKTLKIIFSLSIILFPLVGLGSELSRTNAEDILEAYLLPKYVVASKDEQKPQFFRFDLASVLPIFGPGVKEEKIKELERRGLLTIRDQTRIEYGFDSGSYILYFEFTDTAGPYLIKSDSDKLLVATAEVDSVNVTGISKPSDFFGKTVCEAHYSVQYKPTPFGEVLLGPKDNLTKDATELFVLYDDGWRMDGERLAKPRSKKIISIPSTGNMLSTMWLVIVVAFIVIAIMIVGILVKTKRGRIGGDMASRNNNDAVAFCTQCGEKNDNSASFCISCGARLDG